MYKLNKLAAGSVIAAMAALGGADVALADRYAPKGKVVYDRPTSWSGLYFGVHSGYSWSDFDNTYVAGGGTWSVSDDPAVVGAHLGIQHQWGNVVLGVEGNFTTAIRDNFSTAQCPNPATLCHARFHDVLSVGPRLGWAAGHWMPYVTGGYASTRFADNVVSKATQLVTVVGAGERHDGWYIGAGVEWTISPGWSVGLEYRHYDFSDETYLRHTPAGAPVPGDTANVGVGLDTVTVRASWRFDRPEPRPLK